MTPARVGPWLERQAGWPAVFGLGLAIIAAPAWLAADPLGGFRWNDSVSGLAEQVGAVVDPLGCARLSPDDLAFVASSRTWPALRRHALEPADGQVVPLFRLLTYALARGAGGLAHLATVFALASYAALIGAVAAVGHVVAREDQRLALALAAMAGVAVSSVLEPASTGLAASRSLWAGVAALAMLAALQQWRWHNNRPWWLAAALTASAAAPLLGPGGFAAGPAGLAYLWADGRPRCRRAAALPLVAAALSACVSLVTGGAHSFHLWRGASAAARAVPEALVFQNLGLDVATTPAQGLILTTALMVAWAWSRSGGGRAWPRPNPLEASGAALAGAALLATDATVVAQVGAVVFAAGWWSGLRGTGRGPSGPPGASPISDFPPLGGGIEGGSEPARAARNRTPPSPPFARGGVGLDAPRLTPPTRREILAVLAVLAVLCVAEAPRFRRLGEARVYPLTPAEAKMFPIPTLQWWRTKALAEDLAVRQQLVLKRLDEAEARCLARGIGRDDLRRAYGRVPVPGGSGRRGSVDAIDLLALPESRSGREPAFVRSALGSLLVVPPEPRPVWLPADEPWPPGGMAR